MSYENTLRNKEWLYQKVVIEKLSNRNICIILNCEPSLVNYWLKKHGLYQPKQVKSILQAEDVISRIKEIESELSSLTLSEIATKYGTLYNAARRHFGGIQTALEIAEVLYVRKRLTNDELLLEVQDHYSIPKALRTNPFPYYGVVVNRFGSLKNALKLAGVSLEQSSFHKKFTGNFSTIKEVEEWFEKWKYDDEVHIAIDFLISKLKVKIKYSLTNH